MKEACRSAESLAQCWRGSPANRAFSLGWWNNRAAPNGREFDFEAMLSPKWSSQDWRTPVSAAMRPDLVVCIGCAISGSTSFLRSTLLSLGKVEGGRFSDARFLRLLLGR